MINDEKERKVSLPEEAVEVLPSLVTMYSLKRMEFSFYFHEIKSINYDSSIL